MRLFVFLLIFATLGFGAYYMAEKDAKKYTQKDPMATLPTDTVVKYTLRVAMNKEHGIAGTYVLNSNIIYPSGKENDPEILKMAKEVLNPKKQSKMGTMIGANTVVEAGGIVVDEAAIGGSTAVSTVGILGCGLVQAGKDITKNVIIPKLMSGELPQDLMTMGTGAVKAGVLAATSIPQRMMEGMQSMMGMGRQQQQQPQTIYVVPPPSGVYQQQPYGGVMR